MLLLYLKRLKFDKNGLMEWWLKDFFSISCTRFDPQNSNSFSIVNFSIIGKIQENEMIPYWSSNDCHGKRYFFHI